MKKTTSILLVLLLIGSIFTAHGSATKLQNGVFSSEMVGFGGVITASITVEDGIIADVQFVGTHETEAIGGSALQTLRNQILDKQSDEIDIISGATITSNAAILAVKAALDSAAGIERSENEPLKNGTYSVKSVGYSWTGMISADVLIEDNRIKEIVVVEEHESETGEIAQTAFDLMIPRLIESQSLAVDSVSGATVTSNSIKNCVSQAIVMAGGNPSNWAIPITKKTEKITLDGYDVIVVGLGGSGIMAYCAAAEKGATVFGIETTAKLGGQTATTTGPMIIGSNAEPFKEIVFPDLDDVYRTWIEYVGTEEKSDIIREAVYNNGKYIDFFIDNFGFEFSGVIPSFANPAWSQMWTRYTGETRNIFGANKTHQFDRAMKKAVEMNEKNGYQLELTAKELLFKDDEVVGVRAESFDGSVYEIYGDSVILATGGFVGNDEMMKDNFGRSLNTIASTVSDGTGILMGLSAGGSTYNINVDPMVHIMQVPNMVKNDDLTPDQKALLTALALVNGEKTITVDGVDLDPSLTGVTVLSMIPGYQYYVLYSQEQMDTYKTVGLPENFEKATSHFMGQGGTFEVGKPIHDLDEILEVSMRYGNIIKADSISELARKIDCDEVILKNTLNEVDTTYYAVVVTGYTYGTVGGLNVNASMNVLREDGSSIENLYAVGTDSMGVENVVGKPYTPWGGQANAWIFVSGYLAGTSAAVHGTNK